MRHFFVHENVRFQNCCAFVCTVFFFRSYNFISFRGKKTPSIIRIGHWNKCSIKNEHLKLLIATSISISRLCFVCVHFHTCWALVDEWEWCWGNFQMGYHPRLKWKMITKINNSTSTWNRVNSMISTSNTLWL